MHHELPLRTVSFVPSSWDGGVNEVILNEPRFLADSQDHENESRKKHKETELQSNHKKYNVLFKSYNSQMRNAHGYLISKASIKIRLERNSAGIPWTYYITTSTFSLMSLFSFYLDPAVVRIF